MNSTIIPTPYPRMMGGNTASYESPPTTMKGGKRKRQSKRQSRRPCKKNQRSRKQRR